LDRLQRAGYAKSTLPADKGKRHYISPSGQNLTYRQALVQANPEPRTALERFRQKKESEDDKRYTLKEVRSMKDWQAMRKRLTTEYGKRNSEQTRIAAETRYLAAEELWGSSLSEADIHHIISPEQTV